MRFLCLVLFPTTTMALAAVSSGLGEPVYGPEQLITDYAVLAGDNLKALPPDFTICSSVSLAAFTTALSFFQLLQSNGDPWINLFVVAGGTNKTFSLIELMVDFDTNTLADLPLLPLQWSWLHACLSLVSEENHIAVVVNGEKMVDRKFEALEGLEHPTSLVPGRLLLAKMVPVRGIWYQHRGMVANLNIFSGAMSLEEMVERTAGAECGKEDGDVLAWSSSQWELFGKASFAEVTKEDLCRRESDILVLTEKVPNSEDCMHLCKKLHATGRMASVETRQLFHELTARLEEASTSTSSPPPPPPPPPPHHSSSHSPLLCQLEHLAPP